MDTIDGLLDYLKKVPKGFIVLINVKAYDYLKTNVSVLKVLANDDDLPGVYITVNKPYDAIKRILKEEGVKTEKLFFIDCISRSAGKEHKGREDHVFYLDSPQNLTGLGVAMGEAIRAIPQGDKFLFMDSLSTLLLYHNSGTVSKFSHFLTNRMRLWGLRGILMAVERETDPDFTERLGQFCDKVVVLNSQSNRKNLKINKSKSK